MDKWLMGMFGLSPDQVAQYGVAIVALVVMGALIALFMTQTKNNAANDKARNEITQTSLQIQQQTTAAINEIKEGFLSAIQSLKDGQQQTAFVIKGLVDAVVVSGNDTVDAIGKTSERVLTEHGRTKLDILKAVSNVPEVVEPVVKTALEVAVGTSIKHQDENTTILKGQMELESGKIIERLNQTGGSLASRLDKVLGQIMLMPTAEAHRELVTEVVDIKRAVARIEANQTRPDALLVTTPEPSAVTTSVVTVDVAQPPSLIVEHASAKADDDDGVRG